MSRIKRARRAHSIWMSCGLCAGIAACDEARNEPRERSDDSVLALSQALHSAVAGCAEAARTCESEAGDAAGAEDSCRDGFATCRDAAKESANPGMEAAVAVCAEQAKTCKSSATGDDATDACKEQLSVCIGEAKPDAGGSAEDHEKPDGGSTPPVASCISALHTCLDGDEKARVCTTALQECIAMTVGHEGTPPERDAGKPADAGHDRPDAGMGDKPDAAMGDKPDAGMGGKPDAAAGDKPDAAAGDKPDAATGDKPDAGMSGSKPPEDAGATDAMKQCKEAREQCLANSDDKEACARMLRECRDR